MLSQEMLGYGKKGSVIRELFEYGNRRKAEIGAENVYDFSLGNPSVPAPPIVNETLIRLLEEEDSLSLHGYTSGPGAMPTRAAIAGYINQNWQMDASPANIYMTVGAAASLTITLNALICPGAGEQVLAFAPFFPEYRVFAEHAGAEFIAVPSDDVTFQIDFDRLESAITSKTKAIIVNSPNNPTGAVLTEACIARLADFLREKEMEYGHPIYLISDEPYRELVYGDVEVPYIPCYYDDTVVCYSFSKSLSLPGERIGYIFVSPRAAQSGDLFAAVCGAGRALGFVCAPSLFQKLVPCCLGQHTDLSTYDLNRRILNEELTKYGYTVVKPDGAFYLFVRSLEPDANAFSERAKKHELLLVPSDDFGIPGFVRISYCVTTEMIRRSLPAFRALAEEYRNR